MADKGLMSFLVTSALVYTMIVMTISIAETGAIETSSSSSNTVIHELEQIQELGNREIINMSEESGEIVLPVQTGSDDIWGWQLNSGRESGKYAEMMQTAAINFPLLAAKLQFWGTQIGGIGGAIYSSFAVLIAVWQAAMVVAVLGLIKGRF